MDSRTKYLFMLMCASGFILDCIDKLTNLNFFTQKIKQVTNRFIKELEKLEGLVSESVDSDFMSESYEVFENILEANLTIKQEHKAEFNSKLEDLVREYINK